MSINIDDETNLKILNFLNKHPQIKNRFIEKYPFMYFLLIIDARKTRGSTSLIKEKILPTLLTYMVFLSIVKNNLYETPSKIGNIPFLQETKIFEWIQENPLLTLGVLMLFSYFLLNTPNTSETMIDEPLDYQNHKPHAAIDGPYKGVVNTPLLFNAEKSYDEDGTITSYDWNFGDKTTGSGKIIEHLYTKTGNYNITLTVTDTNEDMDSDSIEILISDKKSSTADQNSNTNDNVFWIISGILTFISCVGIILLIYRRKFF
jgi:hypothetical protein